MKPFNLERALAGDKVMTAGGLPVTDLTLLEGAEETQCLVFVVHRDGVKHTFIGDKNGGVHGYDNDLFMAPRVVWVNAYSTPHVTMAYGSKEQALEAANLYDSEYLGTCQLEIEG